MIAAQNHVWSLPCCAPSCSRTGAHGCVRIAAPHAPCSTRRRLDSRGCFGLVGRCRAQQPPLHLSSPMIVDARSNPCHGIVFRLLHGFQNDGLAIIFWDLSEVVQHLHVRDMLPQPSVADRDSRRPKLSGRRAGRSATCRSGQTTMKRRLPSRLGWSGCGLEWRAARPMTRRLTVAGRVGTSCAVLRPRPQSEGRHDQNARFPMPSWQAHENQKQWSKL